MTFRPIRELGMLVGFAGVALVAACGGLPAEGEEGQATEQSGEEYPAPTDGGSESLHADDVLPPTRPIRIMTYNIRFGGELGLKLGEIAAVIGTVNPDVVGLQEVDHLHPRSAFHREAEELASATGLDQVFFGCTIGCGGSLPNRTGLAILSRFPMDSWSKVFLPNTPEGLTEDDGDPESRVLLCGVLYPPGVEPVRFCVTHFTNGSSQGSYDTRRHQAQAVLDELSEDLDGGGRVILVGDLNETLGGAVLPALQTRLSDAWREGGSGEGPTIDSGNPTVRFDYILHGSGVLPASEAFVPVTTASDHRPVVAELAVR